MTAEVDEAALAPDGRTVHLSPAEERLLRQRGRGMTAKAAAYANGVSEQTIKNQMSSIYQKLDVDNLVGALLARGYVTIPGETAPVRLGCDFIGRCGRALDHRGQHGGFRRLVENEPAAEPS